MHLGQMPHFQIGLLYTLYLLTNLELIVSTLSRLAALIRVSFPNVTINISGGGLVAVAAPAYIFFRGGGKWGKTFFLGAKPSKNRGFDHFVQENTHTLKPRLSAPRQNSDGA